MAIFAAFFGASVLVVLLRSAGVHYPIRMAVKLVSLCLYVYIGAKIGVITSENISVLKTMIISIFRPSVVRRAESTE